MGGAATALLVLLVLLVIGAPVALSLPGPAREWTGIAFEAIVIGLVVEMFVAIVLLHAGWYNAWTALIATLLIVGGATLTIRRFGGPPADLSTLRGLGPVLIGVGAVVFVAVALLIRHAPSYFIFQTGDMGGYVNSANILLRAGQPFGKQPQGFTLFLRETNLLLGRVNTVAGLPALGATLLLGGVAFARALRLHLLAAFGVAFILLVHPVVVWFSLFPVSEALFATLLLAQLYLLMRTRATGSMSYAAVGGVVTGSLLLVRGEAMLLAPILVAVLLVSAALDDAPKAGIQLRFTIVALVSLIVAYTYDVSNAHLYFRAQLRHLLPHFASRFAERAELEHFSVWLVFAGALALGLVYGLTWLVTRYLRPRLARRASLCWRIAYGAVVLGTLLALLAFNLDGLADTWARWGLVLLALGAVGAIGVLVRPGHYLDAGLGFCLFLVVGVFVVLFARRVPEPQGQVYYLYFDRYLFSEVLPAALPLVAIGIQMIVDVCERVLPARIRWVALGMVALLVAVGLVPEIHETQRVARYQLLGDPYGALQQLDRLTRSDGRPGVVVYSGSATRPLHWFYPNTFRAFALPLRQSFDRDVVGLPYKPLVKDRVYSPYEARVVLALNHASRGFLVQLQDPDTARLPDGDDIKWVGSISYTCPVLGQQPDGPTVQWKLAHLRFDVYALT